MIYFVSNICFVTFPFYSFSDFLKNLSINKVYYNLNRKCITTNCSENKIKNENNIKNKNNIENDNSNNYLKY